MKIKIITCLCIGLFSATRIAAQEANISAQDFSTINLAYPGLEKTRKLVELGKYSEAAKALLSYYQQKHNSKDPDFSNAETPPDLSKPVGKENQEMADNALKHLFKPQKGYGFFDYGQDINWQHWPVKDNEVRWQLHRVRWWQAMALVYRSSKDERYAKEWMAEFLDWAKKNPLGLSKENDRFAWRPLEVSDRVQSLAPTFAIFVNSPSITPAFLMAFLKSYHQQANYLPANYAEVGNHRLFEAQRTLFAGTSFAEFKDAAEWRKSGIDVLNTEIGKQVYPDGVQFELSPVYHVAAIDIFLKAYNSAKTAGMEKEFPASYSQTIENMAMATFNMSFPDYQTPMFGDSWLTDKAVRLRQFKAWSKVFPQNEVIRYFATEGKEGKAPNYLSKGLTTAGFYTFRNGWDNRSTVMVLKESPPGEFHAQPDNGTFELWIKGRNFMPDAGCYVYSGDAEIMKMRDWYRQSKVHQTLTLDNQNMLITNAKLNKWQTGDKMDLLTATNPSYANLDHRRSMLFIDQKYFIIIDQAIGKATGNLAVHFQLKEDSQPVVDKAQHKVYTSYTDNNNLLIQSFGQAPFELKEEEGKVSYAYRKETARPAFAFEKNKANTQAEHFVTVLYPFDGAKAPEINIKENAGNDWAKGLLNLSITINGKASTLKANLLN